MRNTKRFQFAAVVALGVVISAGGALLLMRILPGESTNEMSAGGGESGAGQFLERRARRTRFGHGRRSL